MNLILIRHGETDWNRTGRCQGVSDIVLNQNGRKQVRELANSLRNEKISAIYSSDLKRAYETARQIASHHRLPVKVDADLREMNQGEFEGLEFEEIKERYAHILKKWREDPEKLVLPKGESLSQVQERVWEYFEKVLKKHEGETIVMVSHNLAIVTLLCKITGLGLKSFRHFDLQASCKNLIICERGEIKIKELNNLSHLTPMATTP